MFRRCSTKGAALREEPHTLTDTLSKTSNVTLNFFFLIHHLISYFTPFSSVSCTQDFDTQILLILPKVTLSKVIQIAVWFFKIFKKFFSIILLFTKDRCYHESFHIFLKASVGARAFDIEHSWLEKGMLI